MLVEGVCRLSSTKTSPVWLPSPKETVADPTWAQLTIAQDIVLMCVEHNNNTQVRKVFKSHGAPEAFELDVVEHWLGFVLRNSLNYIQKQQNQPTNNRKLCRSQPVRWPFTIYIIYTNIVLLLKCVYGFKW